MAAPWSWKFQKGLDDGRLELVSRSLPTNVEKLVCMDWAQFINEDACDFVILEDRAREDFVVLGELQGMFLLSQ